MSLEEMQVQNSKIQDELDDLRSTSVARADSFNEMSASQKKTTLSNTKLASRHTNT